MKIIMDDLDAGTEKLTNAINRMKAESILEEKDVKRDNFIRGINYTVSGFQYHPDKTISEAAVLVGKLLTNNGGMGMINDSYAVESAQIKSTLADFAKPDAAQAIESIPGLSGLVNALITAQAEYDEADLVFAKEKAEDSKLLSATKIKKEVTSIVNDKLMAYLQGMCVVNNEKYGSFAAIVAQIIDENNGAVRRRRNNDDNEPEG